MVSAWAHEQQLVLGQIATDEKSNKTTAVPKLLDVLDIAGCIVTADSMSCQKKIARKVVEKHGNYGTADLITICTTTKSWYNKGYQAKAVQEDEAANDQRFGIQREETQNQA